jgi:hypothetical protein
MENGSTWGTYIAYGVIVLFLILLTFVVARTVLLYSLLLIQPMARVWSWIRGSRGTPRTDVDPPVEARDRTNDR